MTRLYSWRSRLETGEINTSCYTRIRVSLWIIRYEELYFEVVIVQKKVDLITHLFINPYSSLGQPIYPKKSAQATPTPLFLWFLLRSMPQI